MATAAPSASDHEMAREVKLVDPTVTEIAPVEEKSTKC